MGVAPGTIGQALAVDQIKWTSCAEDALNQVEAGDAEAAQRRGRSNMGMANVMNVMIWSIWF